MHVNFFARMLKVFLVSRRLKRKTYLHNIDNIINVVTTIIIVT